LLKSGASAKVPGLIAQAAFAGCSIESIKSLIAHGADINSPGTLGQMTAGPLVMATVAQRPDLMKFFIEKGTDTIKRDGQDAMSQAQVANPQCEACIKILVDAGVSTGQ